MATKDEQKSVKVTNNAPGPRMVLTALGGVTIPRGQSRNVKMTDNEVKAMKPYTDAGQLVFGEPDPEPEGQDDQTKAALASQPATQPTSENPLGVPQGENDIEPASVAVTSVEHRGFGRWYGIRDGEPVTQAMNKSEAEAFASEHGLTVGAEPNPSATPEDDSPPADATAPADET